MLNQFFLERDFTYETLTNKIMCYDRSVVPIILGLTAKVSPAIMVHIYNCHAVFNKVVTKSTPLSLLLPYMFPYQQLKINGSSNWSVHVNSKHWLIYRQLQICSIRSEKNWTGRSQVVHPIFQTGSYRPEVTCRYIANSWYSILSLMF